VDDETFIFGSFRLVRAQRVLLDDGKPLRLGSRALDILITLVEHAGETISKEQLIAHTWPDTVVDDGALRVHVAALRKALGDDRAGRRYVANNPGRGYAFVAPVTREGHAPRQPPRQTVHRKATTCRPRLHASSAATMSSLHCQHNSLAAVS
jgi:DNA-binding winged helix-turn-helix (wHTH) protein